MNSITIGNAGGYWGDDPEALARQLRGGELDYISMDFLAEITMSILQKQKSRDPRKGYAHDFLKMLIPLLAELSQKKTKIITNAGGIQPRALASEIYHAAQQQGLQIPVGIVEGDDILEQIPQLRDKGVSFANMETGASIDGVVHQLQAANVYFGAAPVVSALQAEPQIVVTGRVTDTGITVAAMIHSLGWRFDDWDKLAAGIVAGHILECGSQSTGGNFTDWHKVPSFKNMGFPIVKMYEDGSFLVTKHPGTGGLVSVDTVREQLFYEMGDPAQYITPDVVCDFGSIQLEQVGVDQVRVFGIKGSAPTPFYKVSMAYADGYKCTGSILVSGPKARQKAEAFSEIFWQRVGHDFAQTATEYLGWNACHRSLGGAEDGNEILLRLGAQSNDQDSLRPFAKTVPALILSGPPGVAVTGGVPRVQEVVSYWPALMEKKWLTPQVWLQETPNNLKSLSCHPTPIGDFQPGAQEVDEAIKPQTPASSIAKAHTTSLQSIALARSGDKGDTANIGVMARSPEAYDYLKQHLTAQQVKDWFQELCHGKVIRYALPNLQGFNFLLEQSLGGGGTKSLRIDPQGKTFAQALLAQTLPIPQNLIDGLDQTTKDAS